MYHRLKTIPESDTSPIFVSSQDAKLKQGWRIKGVRERWSGKEENLMKNWGIFFHEQIVLFISLTE